MPEYQFKWNKSAITTDLRDKKQKILCIGAVGFDALSQFDSRAGFISLHF